MALSKVDRTEAALVALARDGLPGVAVEPLARQLGATKGSFNWHVRDRADLISARLSVHRRRALPAGGGRLEESSGERWSSAAR